MEKLPIDLDEGLKDFAWGEDSILYHVDASTSCKAIYQAVCDEIGRFYQTKGFKYAPVSKKLQYYYQDFNFKIHFTSSHYNAAGDWVWVDISTGMYPVRLEKQYKAAKEKLLPLILYNNGLLDEIIPDRPAGTIVLITPFGEEKESFQEDYPYALRKYSRGFNAYNISLDNFKRIIHYINKLIEYTFRLVLNESEMIDLVNKANVRNFKFYREKRFLDYLQLYYSKDTKLFQWLQASNEGLKDLL